MYLICDMGKSKGNVCPKGWKTSPYLIMINVQGLKFSAFSPNLYETKLQTCMFKLKIATLLPSPSTAELVFKAVSLRGKY